MLVIPIVGARLGWTRVRDAAVERLGPPVPAGRRTRSRQAKYSVLQDDYHERVARRFGLARGEKGCEAVHEAIDRAKAAEARERLAVTETERAEAATAQTYLDEIVAVDARDAAEAQRAAAVDEAERARRMAAEAEQYRTEVSRDAAAVVDLARKLPELRRA